MSCSFLKNEKTTQNYTNIDNPFCKLMLTPGHNIMFNKFTQLKYFFDIPIDIINDIIISFHNYDGSLYDFYGKEHSFVLKFTEIINTNTKSMYDQGSGLFNIRNEDNDYQTANYI